MFVCFNHLAYLRDAWGILDNLVDVYLDGPERERFEHEWKPPEHRQGVIIHGER